ncbi:MAG: uracil-DNA glycosylase family protein [Candidatus Eisenbacteria bacterium]|uniref:Uracil-DNA glycosylase family protein n=1 Tax=Eiseniibacteriota bacterium TaxID=2212470 RepID=A0A7Y2H3R4_UNCEI|nr:uracil-DNA glycosylase family protein [Candidatus Eisenbacteria bacterium]
MTSLPKLLKDVRACEICKEHLPLGPRPVVQVHKTAPILIAGQAPGRRVHESGIPFDDPSGDRLRTWMGIDKDTFYNPKKIAILPMGFCFPGSKSSGDLPPRPECAPQWREPLLEHLPNLKLTLVLGQYAQAYHLPGPKQSVTAHVKAWETHWPKALPLPHPSPRNQRWFKENAWFETEVLPKLRRRIKRLLKDL